MLVQEAFPVDYFVFSCIAPNFPAEKKWMWCWFQTIWAAHLDELFILQLLFLFTVFLTCFRPPRAIARAEMYLNEQKWIFCLFYQSRYFNLKEISGSPWETTDFVISKVPPPPVCLFVCVHVQLSNDNMKDGDHESIHSCDFFISFLKISMLWYFSPKACCSQKWIIAKCYYALKRSHSLFLRWITPITTKPCCHCQEYWAAVGSRAAYGTKYKTYALKHKILDIGQNIKHKIWNIRYWILDKIQNIRLET